MKFYRKMQTTFKVCKLILLLCVGRLTNANPILTGLKTIPSDYQESGLSFHHELSSASNPGNENFEIKPNGPSSFSVDQSLKNSPGITTFRDQNGNLVTQIKKEEFNNKNGQSTYTFELQENKQLPNGYSKSFKKEYSSSSAIQSQPTTFIQKPLTVDKYYNNEKSINEENSQLGQYSQNYQGSLILGNSDYHGIKSNLKPAFGERMTNVPAVTSTFRDQNGNIVTQVKKESVYNNDGQNSHISEFEETKQLPNGYSKSFKNEYSSSSAKQFQPTFIQKPLTVDKYYNNEKSINEENSQLGQYSQNYQGSLILGNSDYHGIKSNLKPAFGERMTNVPAVTTTFRDQNGNIVTQVKKESVYNNDGQNSHISEFEETKQLPNGYSKSFKKEYSSSSAIQSQPTTLIQKPLTVDKYYNNEKSINEENSQLGQYSQNYQGSLILGNSDYHGIKSNLKPALGERMTNVPAVTTTFRDQNGNIVTQVKKESVYNNDGQSSHISEFEETKQLPNGYSKSFKKEYSSSSAIQSQPTTLIQKPLTVDKYYNNEKSINEENSQLGQYSQNYTGSLILGNSDYHGIKLNLKPAFGENMTYVPAVTSTFRDQNGNLVTQVKKESVYNNDGQNSHISEFEETKQLPNGYSKSFKKEYSSSSAIQSQPTTLIQKPLTVDKYYNNEKSINEENSQLGQYSQNYTGSLILGNSDYHGIKLNLKPAFGENMTYVPAVTSTFRDQNGNLVTQVKKESVYNNDGQNSHISEFEETKQLPNGYSKSFKKEYSSSSLIGSYPTNTEIQTSVPQKFSMGEVEKFNGYNTFFNNQKQPLNPSGSINSQIINNNKNTNMHDINNMNLFGNIKEKVDCDESSTHTHFGQESVDLHDFSKSTPIGQESVNIDNLYISNKQDTKPIGQHQIENFKFSSTNTQKVGQEVVDLHKFSKPSQIGQESVNIDNIYLPNKPDTNPKGQKFEKLEFSTHTHTGQESLGLHDFSKSTPIGQESVNIDNLYISNKPDTKPIGQHQIENFEFSSTNTQKVGQEVVDLHKFSKPSQIGQESVNIDNIYLPNKPDTNPKGQQFEKLEFSTHTHTGQELVGFHDFSKSTPIGQESLNIDNLYISNKPDTKPIGQHQIDNFEISSTNTQKVGQEVVDLHAFTKPSQIGQESVNIDNIYLPNKPDTNPKGQKFEKLESSTHTHFGQESVDFHDFSKSTPVGQESINIDNLYISNKPDTKPIGQHQIENFKFSSTNTQKVGQEVVDLHKFSKPSQIGQESVNIDNLYLPNKPDTNPKGQQFEKLESSTHTHFGQESVDLHDFSKSTPIGQESVNIDNLYISNKPDTKPIGQHQIENFEISSMNTQNVGQEVVDLHAFSKPSQIGQESVYIDNMYTSNNPKIKTTGLQTEKLETSYQNKFSSVGQQVNINENSKSGQQFGRGQQIQGLEFLNSNYRDTTHLLDLGIGGQQPTDYVSGSTSGQQNVNNEKHLGFGKPIDHGNEDYQKSEFSSQIGKLNSGKDQSIIFKYDKVFDNLGQLEREILAPKSTVNINKDNVQTSYSTHHNVKSMPQMNQQVSSFSKTINENTQYIEPQSEIISSSLSKKETESVVQQDIIENHEHFTENPTKQFSAWKKFGDKVKGTIQNVKNKAQQLATTINGKVGFSKNTDTENPC